MLALDPVYGENIHAETIDREAFDYSGAANRNSRQLDVQERARIERAKANGV